MDTATVDAQDSIVTTKADAEIEAFDDGVKALDKFVAEAMEQQKEDHEDYTVLMSSAAAATELIEFAKDGLNKFDNPNTSPLQEGWPKSVRTMERHLLLLLRSHRSTRSLVRQSQN